MEIDVVDAALADLDELVALAQTSFQGVTGTGAFGSVLNSIVSAEHLRRKYQTPFGAAKIVRIRDSSGIIASNAMIPSALLHDGGRARGWQSCDTSTHPRARGKGLFKECIRTLAGQLQDGDVFFGYPNANSRRGLESVGWRLQSVLDCYVNPLLWGRESGLVRQVAAFGHEQASLAPRLRSKGHLAIERSDAYLNWRYGLGAQDTYARFIHEEAGRCEGFAVVRHLRSKWNTVCVVMELASTLPHVERDLVGALVHWSRKAGNWPLLWLSDRWGSTTWLREGFVRVPRRLSPRPLLLLAEGIGEAGRRIVAAPWETTIGDWDVF